MGKKVVFARHALHMVATDHWKDWGTSSCRYSPLSRPLMEPPRMYIHQSSHPSTRMTCSRNRAWLLFISNLKHHSFGRLLSCSSWRASCWTRTNGPFWNTRLPWPRNCHCEVQTFLQTLNGQFNLFILIEIDIKRGPEFSSRWTVTIFRTKKVFNNSIFLME